VAAVAADPRVGACDPTAGSGSGPSWCWSARQNGKTTMLVEVKNLWKMFVLQVPLIIGTAQILDRVRGIVGQGRGDHRGHP
jgi:hypothetical protein